MFISTTKRLIVRSSSTWLRFPINKRHNSTIPSNSNKLTSSYCHHASSLPLLYQTVAQKFDENVDKYPNHECYIFKSMSISFRLLIYVMD